MKAWLTDTPRGSFVETEVADSPVRGTEVLVAVRNCGLCHSDLHSWHTGPRSDQGSVALGHEITGTVAACGPDAVGVTPGDSVVVYPWLGCGACQDCISGHDNLCYVETTSLGYRRHGGFADHVLMPHPRYTVKLGDLDPALAATYACSGLTVYSAIRKLGQIDPMRQVAVIGLGGVGLQAVAMLHALGHRAILAVDRSAATEQKARALGASAFSLSLGDRGPEAVPLAGVLDFVNTAETVAMSLKTLRKGGTMVQVGLFGGTLPLDLYQIAVRGISLRGSITGTLQDMHDVLDLARSGALQPIPIERRAMTQVNAAVAALDAGQVSGRIVLTRSD